jgi:hypothetical protein
MAYKQRLKTLTILQEKNFNINISELQQNVTGGSNTWYYLEAVT